MDENEDKEDRDTKASTMLEAETSFTKALFRMRHHDRALTALELSDAALQDADMKLLVEALIGSHPNAHAGEKWHRRCGSAEFVSRSVSLSLLDLAFNRVTAEGVRALADAIPRSNVRNLVLHGNRLGDAGARYLADVLKNSLLEHLDIGQTGVGALGTAAIAEMLRVNLALRILLMGGSQLVGARGLRLLCQALVENATLRKLDVNSCRVEEAGAPEWASMLLGNKALATLVFWGNGIEEQGYEAIETALKNNRSLTELDVCDILYGGSMQPIENKTLRVFEGVRLSRDKSWSSEQFGRSERIGHVASHAHRAGLPDSAPVSKAEREARGRKDDPSSSHGGPPLERAGGPAATSRRPRASLGSGGGVPNRFSILYRLVREPANTQQQLRAATLLCGDSPALEQRDLLGLLETVPSLMAVFQQLCLTESSNVARIVASMANSEAEAQEVRQGRASRRSSEMLLLRLQANGWFERVEGDGTLRLHSRRTAVEMLPAVLSRLLNPSPMWSKFHLNFGGP
jgi:hypothetical protein